jgi:SNF2 family DNA or RNA helicase
MIKLFDFQKKVLEQTANLSKVAFYLEMGLGKTFLGSEKIRILGEKVNLLVCQKSKIDDWKKHFGQNYNFEIFDLSRAEDFKNFIEQDSLFPARVGIINYDLIFRRKEILNLENFTLCLDESSKIQNYQACRTKFILKMKPKNVILLSGTPVSGKYENLWSQLKLLGFSLKHGEFLREFVNLIQIRQKEGFYIKIVNKQKPYRNFDKLMQIFKEYGAVFMKSDEVFDLPKQNFITLRVNKEPFYETFKKTGYIRIEDEELSGDTIFSRRLYLRMICGHFNAQKLDAFRDLCESTGERLVVFYNFNAELFELDQIARNLKKAVSYVTGRVKDLSAYENTENSVIFVQYKAGAMGLNLQKANKIVYFTPTESCEEWMQSLKRVHRIGQNRPCFYYLMVCRDSIEEKIYGALKRGESYTDGLFRKDFN